MKKQYSYADLEERFQSALQKIDGYQTVSGDLFFLKPAENVWSAAEVLDHITQFNRLYIPEMEALTLRLSPAANDHFKPRLLAALMIRMIEPPYKMKIPTLKPMTPKRDTAASREEFISALRATNSETLQIVQKLREDQLNPNSARGSHPLYGWIRMTLTEMLLLIEAHQRRHFWQADQTLKRLSGNSG